MSKPNLRDSSEHLSTVSETNDLPAGDDQRRGDVEVARVLGTPPFRMALDHAGAEIVRWKHEPLRDVVEPMSRHIIVADNGDRGNRLRLERFPRGGDSHSEGSSSRWHISKSIDVVQLCPSQTTLKRIADEAAKDASSRDRTMRSDGATDLSIAAALGYSSQTVFATVFRKLTGEAPSDLAYARALAAIAMQLRQSRWGSGTFGSVAFFVFSNEAKMLKWSGSSPSALTIPRGEKWSQAPSYTRRLSSSTLPWRRGNEARAPVR